MNPVTNTLFTFQMHGSEINCCTNCSAWEWCRKSEVKKSEPIHQQPSEEELVSSLPAGKSFRFDDTTKKLAPVKKSKKRTPEQIELDKKAWKVACAHIASKFDNIAETELVTYCETLKIYGPDHMLDKKAYLHLTKWAEYQSALKRDNSSDSSH